MPMVELTPADATYISRDRPDADYSRAGALVAATDQRRGITEMILLKYPRPSLPMDTTLERAELVLHPWHSRGAQISPVFHIYRFKSDFCGSLATWTRRPRLAGFPRVTQPSSICKQDRGIHCDITCLAAEWLAGADCQCCIALVAQADECLMVHSACGAHPPCLRLICCDKQSPKTPEEEGRRHDCGPAHDLDCSRQALSGYRQKVYMQELCSETTYTPSADISQARTVTFFIKNCSCSIIEAALQISPNGVDWMDDKQKVMVPIDGLTALTPYLFARYIRVGISSDDPTPAGKARVWYQAQSLNYRFE